jgi:hypothetical protein
MGAGNGLLSNLIFMFVFAALLATATPANSGPVPDTGQTKCYSNASEILCPLPEEAFFGQDGSYLFNPPSYTKLDANGVVLPRLAPSWAMVLDNVTGLVWEVKQNNDGVKNYVNPHDADNTYTWYDPNSSSGVAGMPGNGTDTEDFIRALNDARFGGFSDWRMPTMGELRSISDYGQYDPGIDTGFFPNTKSSGYWSSNTVYGAPFNAWCLYFKDGYDVPFQKPIALHVRAVRGGPIGSQLIDNKDGTVTDTSTGVMWQQATAPGTYTWGEALSYCENLVLPSGGYSDWRLPTIKELHSIVDLMRAKPAIDITYFPGAVSDNYWSSTTYVQSPGKAAAIDFTDGHGDDYNKTSTFYVRAVRAGATAPAVPCMADFDGDGDVDGADLAILSGEYGRCFTGQACLADAYPDGVVDETDLLFLVDDFGRADCPNG